MISKNRLKELAAYRLQKRCDEEAVFVVEGPKMAIEALGAGAHVRTICATADWWATAGSDAIADERHEVGRAELERLSAMKSPCQVWMLVERPQFAEAGRPDAPLTLVLDRIQDPGNLGTMLRTADWFGVRHVVCSPDTASHFNPKAVQASMGAVFRTWVERRPLVPWLAECGMTVYGASLQGTPLDTAARPAGPAALVIGNESVGISPEVMARVSRPVLIPNLGGTAESLNAAVAAGILMEKLTL